MPMRPLPKPGRSLTITVAAAMAAATAAALVTACSASPAGTSASPAETSASPAETSASAAETSASAAETAAAPGVQVTGKLGDGAVWIAEYPKSWNGTLLLYSHGFGPLTAADAPDPTTQQALLAEGYALAGSSYNPTGSEWAMDTAVSDQFGTLAAVESTVLPHSPAHVIAFGTSMGGLVSALEAQQGAGKVDGALTTCGVVAGAVNQNEYQIDGEYAIAQLLGNPGTQLAGIGTDAQGDATAAALTADAENAQQTAAGRARLALALAFLNVMPWLSTATAPVPGSNPAGQESAQYNTLFAPSFNILEYVELVLVSTDQADGGNATGNVGTNFDQALASSPFKPEVEALYQQAGLNLNNDLRTLTAHATIGARPAALRSLAATSVPTGRLAVPELDLHTIGDDVVPVENENYYRNQVDKAGSGGLLRQAFTESFGHCNFSPAELVAGVHAIMQRVSTGQWGNAATTASLERAATALKLGPARFTDYSPGGLTGAVPTP
jgi:hypothetical protein